MWLRDVSIVDILWAPAFAVLAWTCAIAEPSIGARGWIVLALVTAWALRLGLHIGMRWRRLGHEDYRYAAIRRRNGPKFPFTSRVWIFWLQALLLWVISWPLQAALSGAGELGEFDFAAIAMIVAGIAIEAMADAQLTRFRADPGNHDRVMDRGLWAWSRHPNYFGDFLMWWGFFVLDLAAGGPWWTILGPVAMSALLLHYSGAGLMEDTIRDRRPGYADYVRRTSLFLPWPPRARAD
jgi:steroid 5-alpha reductase family enzyme